MALNDCVAVTSTEIIDTTLSAGAVTVVPASLASAGMVKPALSASWSAIGNLYVTGVQFEYVPNDASGPAIRTAPQGGAALGWNATDGIVGGKAYDVRHRAVASSPTAYGSWVSDGTITVPVNSSVSGLGQGGTISVGGSTKLPASLEPFVLALTDGQVITFAVTYPVAPLVAFSSAGLSPLASGETYYFNAEGLTGSGFTARIKKRSPAAPTYSTRTDGPTLTETAPDDWQMEKGISNDAYNGIYTFRVQGQQHTQRYVIGGEPTEYEGGMLLGFWVRPGGVGSWTAIGTGYVNPAIAPSGNYTYDLSFAISTGVAIGSGAGTEYKATVDWRTFSTTQDKITRFESVTFQWQSGGGAPTDVSATPSGETCIVTITPKNS